MFAKNLRIAPLKSANRSQYRLYKTIFFRNRHKRSMRFEVGRVRRQKYDLHLGRLEKGFYCSISVVPSVISHYKDALERFVFLLQLFEQSDCRLSINGGALLITTSVGSCALTTAVDIDPLPATVGLNLFVLALLYPTVCTMCIMLWVSTISVINGGFSAIFCEFCLNHAQELLLLCFIGFARYSLRFLIHEIKSAQEMPQTTKTVRDSVCCLKCVP